MPAVRLSCRSIIRSACCMVLMRWAVISTAAFFAFEASAFLSAASVPKSGVETMSEPVTSMMSSSTAAAHSQRRGLINCGISFVLLNPFLKI